MNFTPTTYKLALAQLFALACFSFSLSVQATESEEQPGATANPVPSTSQEASSTQPAQTPTVLNSESRPSNPTVPPIQMKQRPPIPEPPPSTLLPPPLTSFSRKPLAWRHKALKLSLDQYKVGKTLTRLLVTPASKDAVLEALGRTIEEFDFRIESYSAPAGHVLAVSNADSAKLIFAITPQGSMTQIRVLVDAAGQTCNASFIDSFCGRLDAALNKKELL